MNEKSEKAAQANANNFNENPVAQFAAVVALGAGAFVGIHAIARKIAENDIKSHMKAGYMRNR